MHVALVVGHPRTLPLKLSPRSYTLRGVGLRVTMGKDSKGRSTVTFEGTKPGRVVLTLHCEGGHSQDIIADVS